MPIVCLLLAVVTLALYNPVNRHPFVNYDDDRYVTENPHIRQGLTGDTITWALTSTEQANWHPLTWMSHALDISLFRLNPAGHHFTSVIIHIANAILLFLLLMWATNRLGPSLFVAALFALHPVNVESVAWIAERKNVLCTFFFFLSIWGYGWYAKKPDWKRYLVVAAAFAAGLAAKPMVITLPFVLMLLDYWPIERTQESNARRAEPWTKLVIEKIPLLALSTASAVITMHAQQIGGAVRSTQQFPLGVRLANAVNACATYLWKMIWPTRLAPLYPHPGDSLSVWQVATASLVLLAITAAVVKFRRHRYLPVGWFFFLGNLVPVIGLVQVGEAAMADRYSYVPLIGVFVMISFGLADVAQATNQKLVPVLAAAAALIALSFATNRQISYWQSNEDLWSHTLAVTQNNFVAEDNLGGALILQGKEEEAHAHFESAALINPKDAMSHSNVGTYDLQHGHMQEAIQQYQTAIALTSDAGLLAQTYANLGAAYRAVGDNEQAKENYNHALRLNPNQFNALLGLGLVAQKQGNLTEAITNLSRSVELQPTAQGYLSLGRALAQSGRNDDALAAFNQAIKISPDLTEAQQAAAALRQQPVSLNSH
ncbi:MAG TPA: tetratricopeptide repeat protein [Candidatus Sulfotelmatobacter sp.]|nr:tetratricopeptide repeat protein [Candidatus Sulfotelmatobacter sp.]